MNFRAIHRLRPFLFAVAIVVAITGLTSANRAVAADDDDGFNVPPTAPTGQRQGGGARGDAEKPGEIHYTLSILSPADSTGLTAREQPVIYWYLNHDAADPVRISILIPKKAKPLFAQELPAGTKAGIHKLDLASEKQDGKPVKLEAGVPYTVTVKVMKSGSGPAGDPFASCKIVRVDPDKAPADAARESDPAKRAAAYGKAGMWFDYLDALHEAIAAKPDDEALLQKRTKALAKQRLIWKPDGTITEERKTDAKP
jgi:hypothetical protein